MFESCNHDKYSNWPNLSAALFPIIANVWSHAGMPEWLIPVVEEHMHNPPCVKPLFVLRTPQVIAPEVDPIVLHPLPPRHGCIQAYVRHSPVWIRRALDPNGPNGRPHSADPAGSAMTGQSVGFHYEEQAAHPGHGPESHAEVPGGSEVQHTDACRTLVLLHWQVMCSDH